MTWVDTLVVIRRMATCTGVRSIGVIAVMTGFTIIGNGNVRPGKRVEGGVIKCGRYPGRFRMATLTISRELCSRMVRICCQVVVFAVAPKAGVGGIIKIAIMTSSTIILNDSMCPIQRVE